ncbi:MAG: ATP-binding cassette domain-containing protein [Nitrospirae bacterium]|nr:ATP-binding cassette domain-containing protein [Nitrospirota bacterium]
MALRLTASHITKGYDGNPVLRDCTFSFAAHGVYVLTGANGCGKSTFLRICALIEAPESGDIDFFSVGAPLPKDLALRRRITLVLPRVGVFNTTVFGNVSYGLRIRGIGGSRARKKVSDALEFAGLTHKKDQNALTLSSGETQRLGIARALVIEPEILFLDEPTASVDQKNTEIIEEIILNMKRDRMTTVVITTHDREQAKRLSDFPLIMDGGKISAV